jgi:hypothetical protein
MIGCDQLNLVETPRVSLEYQSLDTTGPFERAAFVAQLAAAWSGWPRTEQRAAAAQDGALHEPTPDPNERG